MSNFLSAIVSYTLAALAGVCFVGGVALLYGDDNKKGGHE